jgi:formylglycine-generating enzyme required for sulfatase activity
MKKTIVVMIAAAVLGGPGSVSLRAADAEVYQAWPFDAKEAVQRQRETAKALGKPREVTVDLGGGMGMKFVLIPAGKFMMGDTPGREETIPRPFYMGEFKVTQAQYAHVMGKNPSKHAGATNPVDSVSWEDATEFCKKASEKTKKNVHLPTEAEWEDACRAGTATRCYWGDDESKLSEYCWWHDNCEGKTHPVGEKKPNAWGLYDVMGLLWEWCTESAAGTHAGAGHPCRGATFGSRVPMFHSSVRLTLAPGTPANDRFGFRVMMDMD